MKGDEAFSKIIGHGEQRADLLRMVKSNKVPHGLLFSGPSGIGKKTIARDLASLLLSSDKAGHTNERALATVRSGNHPDLLWLRRDSEKRDITVEAVRELISQLRLVPYSATCKVAIIDNAHELNTAAANALLMTLEEPVPNTYLFLVSDSAHRLPATILSRCQIVHFNSLTESEAEELLIRVLGEIGKQSKLRSYLEGSLSLLELEELADPRSLLLPEEKKILDYCETKIENIEKTAKRVEVIIGSLESEDQPLPPLLAVAAEIAADKDAHPTFWQLFERAAYKRMRKPQGNRASFWAKAIRKIISSEQLIRERNVNPSLQLSSLLVNLRTK